MLHATRSSCARFTLSFLLLWVPGGCGGKESAASSVADAGVIIAAAADLKLALDDLIADYKVEHPGRSVRVSYGSSGSFHAQLQNRAPFDLYFSADVDYPRRLAKGGLALDNDVFMYAVGRIVIWVPKSSSIQVETLGSRALLDPTVQKIAIANPHHAPYGRAAVAALKTLAVHDQVADKLVLGENIAQTAQFVQSGAADIGVIALALAVSPAMKDAGRYWECPLDSYPTMEQGGMVTKWARDPAAAKAFRDFVLASEGRSVLERYGFYLPK